MAEAHDAVPTRDVVPTGPEDLKRLLAAERREREREFEAKTRDLKQQEARRRAHLDDEKAEFEGHRRAVTRELAERAQKLAAQEQRATKLSETKLHMRNELTGLRNEVEDLDAQRKAAEEQRAAWSLREGKLESVRKAQSRGLWLSATFAGLALLLLWGGWPWLAAGSTLAAFGAAAWGISAAGRALR